MKRADSRDKSSLTCLSSCSLFLQAYLREAKCHLALGFADASVRSLNRVIELDPHNKLAQSEVNMLLYAVIIILIFYSFCLTNNNWVISYWEK